MALCKEDNEMTTTSVDKATGLAARPRLLMPFLDLQAQYLQIRHEIIAAIMDVMESQHFILGPQVEGLEAELCRFLGCEYAVGCASGSDALLLALMALKLQTGDEVVTTPFTFIATAGSICRLGLRPVFVDIDPETYNIDPRHLDSSITTRARAILPVHLFGLPGDMEEIMRIAARHNLQVIEDAAQAISAQYHGIAVVNFGDL